MVAHEAGIKIFSCANGSDSVQALCMLGWKLIIPLHGSELRVVTCLISLGRLEDISILRAVGTTAHHLFKVVKNILISPLEFWIAP